MLADVHQDDILPVEQVDRLCRPTAADWDGLKVKLKAIRVRVVALDVPTSWTMAAKISDDFTGRIFETINKMLLDILAAVACEDGDDRRRRQAQGRAKAKAEGRAEDKERNAAIAQMIAAKQYWTSIRAATGCSRATIAKWLPRAA